MAIVQISKIQVRTGAESDLPQLDIGELGFATDTRNAYIGNDPVLDPPVGIEPTLTQLLTDSPNCHINSSQLTGVIDVDVGNIKIAGGTNGYLLQTDGNGNLGWVVGAGGGIGLAGGSNTQIQFNDTGNSVGVSNLTFNKTNSTLTLTGNLVATNITGNIAVNSNAQPNITSVGTLVSLGVTGNITSGNATLGNLTVSNYFSGDGSLLTDIAADTAITVTANAQPNITTVGTLAELTVSGDVVLGSITDIKIGGGTPNQLLRTDGLGNLTWVSDVGAGGIATYGNLDVQTFMNANYIPGFTGVIPKAQTAYSIDGSNVVGPVDSANVANTATTSVTVTANNQPNITSVGTLGNLSVTANINSDNLIATGNISGNYIIGNGSRLTSITGTNITGVVANATYATSAGSAGTATIATVATNSVTADSAAQVIDAGQPNITSVGTLISLTVTGNISAGNANLGNLTTSNYFTGILTTAAQPNITSVGTTFKTIPTTFSVLPTASTAGAGTRAFITDANTTVFGSEVSGTGSNNMPVFSNGTNWLVG
jgi:hypothetical protein